MINPNNKVKTIFCDVDQTLINWDIPEDYEGLRLSLPKRVHDEVKTTFEIVEVIPIEKHIELIKHLKREGYKIIVWSHEGEEWATEAVLALGLENEVDLTIDKPLAYVDDKEAKEFMGERIYLEEGGYDEIEEVEEEEDLGEEE